MAKRPPPQAGVKGVRAHFQDALALLEARQDAADPPSTEARKGIPPGQWPGHPVDCLPPDCPVTPLGVDGGATYLIDSMGQLRVVQVSEWGKRMLVSLFMRAPNFPEWAWPRFSTQAKGHVINGLEADLAAQCLIAAAARRGLFSPMDRVRGRGGWALGADGFVWHAGDMLFTVRQGRMVASRPGEIDGVFYPQRPPVLHPWMAPVEAEDSPAHDLLRVLQGWRWERPGLDPFLVLGWLGSALLGGALPWRPTLFMIGDRGVGKSSAQALIKAVLGDAAHAAADTTPAGVYQRVRQDSLAVAIDELEAGADNRRVMAVVALARLAASGAMMYRGGAEHEGVEFRLQNCMAFSAINPPPLEPADRSRMAIVNLRRLAADATPRELTLDGDTTGRMLLRALMDAWPRFAPTLKLWRGALRKGGLDQRGQDTFGTLLAVAHLLLGDEAMEAGGFDVTEEDRLGEKIGAATSVDRTDAENWRGCLEYLMGATIEAWRDGTRPTVGGAIEGWEKGHLAIDDLNARLALIDLRASVLKVDGTDYLRLAVPLASRALNGVFANQKWGGGVWGSALKQAPDEVVIRNLGNGQNVRINRVVKRCLWVDFAAYDRVVREGG